MPGSPLSLPEREEILVALTEEPGLSWASIARRVDRHPTTIAREVDRCGGRARYSDLAERRAEFMTLVMTSFGTSALTVIRS